MFLNIANKKQLAKKISLNTPKFKSVIIRDAQIERLDKEQILQADGYLIRDSQTADLHNAFIQFAIDMAIPFAKKRSYPVIKRAIYRFFEQETSLTDLNEMANIVLFEKNKPLFFKIISDAKDQFTKEVVEKVEREKEDVPNWNVPKIITYTKDYGKQKYDKYILNPAYVKLDSDTEKNFTRFLEKESGVKWWFKNGVNDKKYFAIGYEKLRDMGHHSFYVDFVVYMNDGRIGLFDTKSGHTAENEQTKSKAESLSKYITDNTNKKLFGGIVIMHDGEWLYNYHEEYDYNENDFLDWEPLILN